MSKHEEVTLKCQFCPGTFTGTPNGAQDKLEEHYQLAHAGHPAFRDDKK